MAKRLILSVFTVLAGLCMQAQPLTEQEALQRAKGFMSGKTFKEVSKTRGGADNVSLQPYYVFNAQEGGFVIVSGDERTMPVLGYADDGSLNMDNLPIGLQDLLNRYADQVKYMQENNLTEPQPQRASTRGAGGKGPLTQTEWNQQSPYWDLCPLQDGINCYTGCTATAMAQVMYYWAVTKGKNTPAKTTKASESYTPHVTGSMEGAAFAANTPINWSKMTTTYNNSSTSDAKTAVAQLMSYCGTAVKMAYNKKGSYGSEGLMSIVPYALKEYFSYPNTVTFEAKESYLWKDWVAMILAELDADRPVMYSATSTGPGEGGHAFIIDGYDSEGNFHINWGYSGKNNGYYALNVMQYSDKYRYNLPDNMITGFCPDEIAGKTIPPLRITATNFGLDTTADGELCLNCNFYNYTGQTVNDFQFGYGYIDQTTNKVVKLYNYKDNFTPEKGFLKSKGKVKSKSIKEMVKDLEITSCTFYPICKLKSETEWRLCNNGDNNVYLSWSLKGENLKIISRKFAPSHGLIMTPPAAKTNLVYTGSALDLIVPGIMLEGNMNYWLEGESNHDNTAIPQGTNAGEYTVCYYDEMGEYASLQVTIAPQPISNPTITLSQSSYTYDGKEKKPDVTVKVGSTTYTSAHYNVSYSNNMNAGTATVTISPMDGSNYAISGSTTFAITKAEGSVTAPVTINNLTYTGAAQNLITAGSSTTGTIKYSLDGTNYGTSVPQGTDAKAYTVYYKVEGDANHKDVAAASLKVTISPKTVSNPTIMLSQTSYTSDGTAKRPTVTVKDGSTTIPAEEYTVSYSNNTEIGTATVTITNKDGGNYTLNGSTTFEIVLKGDANRDKKVNVADIVKLVNDHAPQSDIETVVNIIMK